MATALRLALALAILSRAGIGQDRPIKIFILAGGSPMCGAGAVADLQELLDESGVPAELAGLRKDGEWTQRDDVWVTYDRGIGTPKNGRLTIGFGRTDTEIGPELGFGRIVGEAIDDPVLLIKCCREGASLQEDFLPPGAGGPGPDYTRMLDTVRRTLTRLKAYVPPYAGQGFDVAGAVWLEDEGEVATGRANPKRGASLDQFVRDLRRDLSAPDLPVVIATPDGHGGNSIAEENRHEARERAAATGRSLARVVTLASRVQSHEIRNENPLIRNGSDAAAILRLGASVGRAMVALLATGVPDTAASASQDEPPNETPSAQTPARPEQATEPAIDPRDLVARRKALQPRIDAAIGAAVEWLTSQQLRDGSWGAAQDAYPCGQTALSVYTLLKCGASTDDDAVRRGLGYLAIHEPNKTYEIGCMLMALEAADAKRYKKRMIALHDMLVRSQNPGGGWGYGYGNRSDLSNTQYAALGLRAASLAGIRTPKDVLARLADYALGQQEKPRRVTLPRSPLSDDTYAPQEAPAAGFTYFVHAPPAPFEATGSMTCGGISVLAIVRDCYGRSLPRVLRRRMQKSIDQGLNWLQVNWTVEENPAADPVWKYYYLYGLERVGALLLEEVLAGHPWYVEGAEAIVDSQEANGRWNGEGDTCFALLFLNRATWNRGGTTGESPRHRHLSDAGDVKLLGTGNASLYLTLRGFSADVLRRHRSTDAAPTLRIVRVEYVVDDAVIARRDGNVAHPWRKETYAVRHEFTRKGDHTVQARVFVLPPGADHRGADTKLEILESAPLTVTVTGIEDPLAADVERAVAQGLIRGARIEYTASSELEHYGYAESSTDGREATAWLSTTDDEKPSLRLDLPRGVVARWLIVSPAYPPLTKGKVARIDLKLNGHRKTRSAVPAGGCDAVKFDLRRRHPIQRLELILERASPETSVGIAEIYFLN